MTTLNQAKSYAQLAKNVSNTEEVLKIKVANIENIQKIIKGNNNSKPKPYINMTTKGLLCKQAIVPVIERKCGQTWTKVRVKYYNY